jgi:phage portal protein BeeE
MINEYLLLTGNAYIRFVEGIGMGEEVVILDTSRTEIICNAFGQIKQYKYTNPNGDVDPIDPSEILHIKSSNVVNTESEEVKYGLSPLQAGWVIVQSSSEKFNAEASIFKNRGVIGFATNDTDIPMQSTEQEEMQNMFNSQTGGSDKFNGIHVTNTRLRFVQTGMSPTDLKLLEGITSSLRQLCAIYGMPSVLFNDVEKSTFNNYETAVKVAYTDVYIPLENKVNRDLSQWLSEKLGVDEEIKVDLNSIEAIKLTTNEVAQALKSLDTKAQERVLENMSQEEIRSLVRLADLPDGVSVIGASATNTNDEGSS